VLGGQHKAPATLTPVKPFSNFTEGWVDLETSRKISLPPAFKARTLEPVVSRYVHYAIPATSSMQLIHNFRRTLSS
jgi:hypothetical protein